MPANTVTHVGNFNCSKVNNYISGRFVVVSMMTLNSGPLFNQDTKRLKVKI